MYTKCGSRGNSFKLSRCQTEPLKSGADFFCCGAPLVGVVPPLAGMAGTSMPYRGMNGSCLSTLPLPPPSSSRVKTQWSKVHQGPRAFMSLANTPTVSPIISSGWWPLHSQRVKHHRYNWPSPAITTCF